MEHTNTPIFDIEKARFRHLFCEIRTLFFKTKEIPRQEVDRVDFFMRLGKANFYKKENALHESLRVLFKLMEDYPYYEHGYAEIGMMYGMLGIDYEHALEYLEFSAAIHMSKDIPTLIKITYYSSLIRLNSGKFNDALRDVELLSTFPFFDEIDYCDNICFIGASACLSLNDMNGVDKWTKKIINSKKENSTSCLLIAIYYWSTYQFEEAKKTYEKALLYLEDGKHYLPWGSSIFEQQFSERLKAEKIAIFDGLANYYNTVGDFEKSLDCYSRVIELNPDYSPTHFGLSLVYGSMGDGSKMKNHLSKFIDFFVANEPASQMMVSHLLITDSFKNKNLRDEMLDMLVDKKLIHRMTYYQAKKIMFMRSEEELEYIKELIMRNELKLAIDKMMSKTPYNTNEELIQLSGRFSNLQSQNRSGILKHDDYEISLNKIRMALIDIVNNELKQISIE